MSREFWGKGPRFLGAALRVFITFLYLGAAGNVAQAVTCEAEPTDMAVAYGEQILCDIGLDSDAADTDLYRFSGNAGDRILAEAVYVSGVSFTPRIQLIAPDGTELVDTWIPARIDTVLPQSGTYTAVISEFGTNNIGEYDFMVSCIAGVCPLPPSPPPGGNVACEAEPTDMLTQLGERAVCGITPGTDTDVFRFTGDTGDRILAEAVDVGGVSFTPRIQLIAPDGTELVDAWIPARVDMILPQTGSYTAIVSEFGANNVGDYAYTVSCTGGNCLAPNGNPYINLSLTGCVTCLPGDRLIVEANIANPGGETVPAEVKIGLRTPSGATINVLPNPHLEAVLGPGVNLSFTLIDFPIQGGTPAGIWSAEGTLLGPDLGETISRDIDFFEVTP